MTVEISRESNPLHIPERKSRRICCFTTVFCERDYLKEIPSLFVEEGIDYYCFTDEPDLRSSSYQVIYVGDVEDGREENRRYKILWDHPLLQQDYDFYVYLDATLYVRAKLSLLIESLELSGSDLISHYYAKNRRPWNGLLGMRNNSTFVEFARHWHETMLKPERRMRNGAVRDEYVYFDSIAACPDLKLSLLPYRALPLIASPMHHKHLSISPKWEQRVLGGLPLHRLGLFATVGFFLGGLVFRRQKIAFLRRSLEKMRAWL